MVRKTSAESLICLGRRFNFQAKSLGFRAVRETRPCEDFFRIQVVDLTLAAISKELKMLARRAGKPNTHLIVWGVSRTNNSGS